MKNLKKIVQLFSISFILSGAIFSSSAMAATLIWDLSNAGCTGVWSDDDCWDGGGAPTVSDTVRFDGAVNSGNSTMDGNFTVDSLYVEPDYSGTLDFGSNIITIEGFYGARFDIDDSGGATVLTANATLRAIGDTDDVYLDFTDDTYNFDSFILDKTYGGSTDRRLDLSSGIINVTGSIDLRDGYLDISNSSSRIIADNTSTFTIQPGFDNCGNCYFTVKSSLTIPDLSGSDPPYSGDNNEAFEQVRWTLDDGGSITTANLDGGSEYHSFHSLVITNDGGTFTHAHDEDLEFRFSSTLNGGSLDITGSADFINNFAFSTDFTLNGGDYDQSLGTGTATLKDLSIISGTFDGPAAAVDIEDLDQDGGTFNSGGGLSTLTMSSANISGGIFDGDNKDITIDSNFDFRASSGTVSLGEGSFNSQDGLFIEGDVIFNCETSSITVLNFYAPDSGGTPTTNCSSVPLLDIGSRFEIGSATATFDAPAEMTVGGTFFLQSGADFNPNGGTVIFDEAGFTNISGTDFNNVIIDKDPNATPIVVGISGAWDVNGDLEIINGELELNNSDINVAGDFTVCPSAEGSAACALTTPGYAQLSTEGEIVTLDGGDQAINGDVTFEFLTKNAASSETLTLEAGKTVNVTNIANLKGSSGGVAPDFNLLILDSSNPGVQANFAPTGTIDFEYLRVTDNNNTNGGVINLIGFNSEDGGNNTNWKFSNAIPTISSLSISPSLATEFSDLTAVATVSDTDVEDNPLAIYNWEVDGLSITQFNLPFETNGSLTASETNDFSGNDYIGDITNATWASNNGVSGNSGAYSFDGSGDYITLPNVHFDTITVSAWFNTNNVTANQRIISKTQSAEYHVSLNENSACTNDTLCFLFRVGTVYHALEYPVTGGTEGDLTNNQWYHIAGTYDGQVGRFYLDGVEVDTVDLGVVDGIDSNTSPICVGSEAGTSTCNGGSYFNGEIDQVIISDLAFSENQIIALANNQDFSVISASETSLGEEWTVEATPVDAIVTGTPSTASVTINVAPAAVPEFSDYLLLLTLLLGFGFIYRQQQSQNLRFG